MIELVFLLLPEHPSESSYFKPRLVTQNLERLKIGLIGDGTHIGKAIGTGVSRKDSDKIMILLTDGSNNDTTISPITAAEAAEAFKIKILQLVQV